MLSKREWNAPSCTRGQAGQARAVLAAGGNSLRAHRLLRELDLVFVYTGSSCLPCRPCMCCIVLLAAGGKCWPHPKQVWSAWLLRHTLLPCVFGMWFLGQETSSCEYTCMIPARYQVLIERNRRQCETGHFLGLYFCIPETWG